MRAQKYWFMNEFLSSRVKLNDQITETVMGFTDASSKVLSRINWCSVSLVPDQDMSYLIQ